MFALVGTDQTPFDNTPLGTEPSKDPTTIGAGFVQQTRIGVRQTDPYDDRVSYEASNFTPNVPQAVSIGLGASLDTDGYQAANGGGLFGPTVQAPNPTDQWGSTPPRTQVDAFEQNVGNGGSFSEEDWRPQAGLPLSGTSDLFESVTTDDFNGTGIDEEWPYLVTPGVRNISERALGIPDRLSGNPSQVQHIRPWDTVLGSWPWTGEKSAQRPPVAGQPFNDDDGIANALPSPTGAGGWVGMTNDLSVRPLSFRTAPAPWDTGTDGTYVDSGV